MRLIAFGCSLTYGAGLKDCFIPPDRPGPRPSKHSWPFLIAQELNIECINQSRTGSSNKEIWHNIISFDFKDDDIIFIMWTYPDRTCILHPKKDKSEQIGIWNNDKKIFYKDFYSEYDTKTMSRLFVSHANCFLEKKNVKVFNLVVDRRFKYIFKMNDQVINHIPVYIWTYENQFQLSQDNNHGNEECHREVARLIMNHLQIEHTISKQKKMSILKRFNRLLTNL